MKFLIWCIVITLWCINYYVYVQSNTKGTRYFILATILQTITTALLIWLLVPSYYSKYSFYVLLYIPTHVFTFYAGSILITGIMCATYKGIGHLYLKQVKRHNFKYDLQLRIDAEDTDKEIDKFFCSHILYLIMIVLTIWVISDFK